MRGRHSLGQGRLFLLAVAAVDQGRPPHLHRGRPLRSTKVDCYMSESVRRAPRETSSLVAALADGMQSESQPKESMIMPTCPASISPNVVARVAVTGPEGSE